MRYFIALFVVLSLLITTANAQTGTAYGIKGGLTAGTQSWNNSQREYLVAYNGSLFIESVHDSMSLRFFGQLGYAKKGSAMVVERYIHPQTGQEFPRRVIRQPFEQVNLVVGAKNMYPFSDLFKGYYGAGIRLDYLLRYNIRFLNVDDWVNKLTYGLSFAGGVEYQPDDSPVAFQLEAMFNQDLSNQIFYENLIVVDQNGNSSSHSARVINSSLDITLGIKFIRRIIWVDTYDDSFLPSGKNFNRG